MKDDLFDLKTSLLLDNTKTEMFDIDKLNFLLLSEKIGQNDKMMLKKYYKKRVNGNNVIINYVWNKKSEEERVYPKENVGLSVFSKNIRGFLGKKYYYDVDIENCHPVIIYNLCKYYGWECTELSEYVEKRNEYIIKIMEQLNNTNLKDDWDKNDVKSIILSLINGSDNDYNNDNLKKFLTEMERISINIKDKYSFLIKKEKEFSRKKICHILFKIERKLITDIHNYLTMKRYNIDVFIHDGFLIRKEENDFERMKDDIEECERYIINKYNLQYFKLKIKELETNIKKDQNITIPKTHIEIACKFIEYTKDFCYNDLTRKFYYFDSEKGYWESDILNKRLILEISSEAFALFCHFEDKKCLGDTHKYEPIIKCLKPFLHKDIIFNPYNIISKYDNKLNTFTTFKTIHLQQEINEIDIKDILNHIKVVWANNNEIKYNYILDWFSYFLKNGKNKTSLVIIGGFGSGKSLILEYFREYILGEKYCYIESDIKKVFGDFNGLRQNKLLIVLEEKRQSKGGTEYDEKIKDGITGMIFTCNKKNIEEFETSNINNFVFISNNRVPVKLEPGDRRFVVLKTNDCFVGNMEYFTNLLNTIQNPEYANKFYTYLVNRNLTNYNPFKKISTKEEEDMKLESSSVGIFIKHIKSGEYNLDEHLDNNEIFIEDLYNLYIEFHNENKLFQCYKMSVKVQFKEQFQKLYTTQEDIVYLIKKNTNKWYFQFVK